MGADNLGFEYEFGKETYSRWNFSSETIRRAIHRAGNVYSAIWKLINVRPGREIVDVPKTS